jgi:hypothetical protein
VGVIDAADPDNSAKRRGRRVPSVDLDAALAGIDDLTAAFSERASLSWRLR